MAANRRRALFVILLELVTPSLTHAQDAGTPPTPVVTPTPAPVPKPQPQPQPQPQPRRRSPPLRPKAKPREQAVIDQAVIEQLELLMLLELLKDYPVIEDGP